MKGFPHKAFVLAAGFGTRMLPLTRMLPKPMLPIWGTPALEHTLRLLESWGVRDVVINVHHLPNEILQHVLHRPVTGLRIEISFEAEILGTGGALPRARWFFDEQPFWLINADVLADVDPRPLVRAFQKRGCIAAAWMHDCKGPLTVELKRGRVVDWHSPRKGQPGLHTLCGLHLLSPDILQYLPSEGFASIIKGYQAAMADGRHIAGCVIPQSYWADIGTPAQYLEAHREILAAYRAQQPSGRMLDPDLLQRMRDCTRRGVRITGFAAIARTATVERGATLSDTVVWDHASLGRGTKATQAIIGKSAEVSGTIPYLALRGVDALDPAEEVALKKAGWSLAGTTAYPLGPRGSQRIFTRVTRGAESVMLVHYNPERVENRLYAGHTRFLHRLRVPVPAVLWDDPPSCVSVYEDLGDASVQQLVPAMKREAIIALYKRILVHVHRFHEAGVRAARQTKLELVPPFRWKLYRWEHELFADHMLRQMLEIPEERVQRVLSDLRTVAKHLLKLRPVLVHRDLQSSNIILKDGEVNFIDFQGMRYGPAAYDLASLLCDPYVSFDAGMQAELLGHYAARTSDPASLLHEFRYAALQRLAQALGAYGRLSKTPGMAYFSRYIQPAFAMMQHVIADLPSLPHLRELIRSQNP